jgi:hypothetical protein
MTPRPRDPLAQIEAQLRIQTGLLATLTYQRTGVRPTGFDHLVLPDPFARLVPYAKAMTLAQIELLRRVSRSGEAVDAWHELTRVTGFVGAAAKRPERAPVPAVDQGAEPQAERLPSRSTPDGPST